MKLKNILSIATIATLLAACGQHLTVPSDAKMEARLPKIYPDYTEVTIPANICPMNFIVQEGESEVRARFTFPGGEYIYGEEQKILIDETQCKSKGVHGGAPFHEGRRDGELSRTYACGGRGSRRG